MTFTECVHILMFSLVFLVAIGFGSALLCLLVDWIVDCVIGGFDE